MSARKVYKADCLPQEGKFLQVVQSDCEPIVGSYIEMNDYQNAAYIRLGRTQVITCEGDKLVAKYIVAASESVPFLRSLNRTILLNLL